MKRLVQLRLMRPIKYLIAAAAASIASSLLVSGTLLMFGLSNDIHSELGAGEYITFGLFSIFISPIIETIALISLIRLIELTKLHEYVNIAISSAVAAGIHSIFSLTWGPIVFFPFIIFSATYLIWRTPETKKGFKMCCGAHVLHNCLPGFVAIYEGTMILASNG